MPAPVIMVHGAFCGGWVFDRFKAPFEAAGHRCITPDLPGHGATSRNVCGQSMADYAKSIVEVIDACEAPPVLIGHSLGGLVAQMAATRRPLKSLILLAPSSAWGVASGSTAEAAAAIGLMSLGAYWTQAIPPQGALTAAFSLDRLPTSEQADLQARMVSESGRALWETFNWWMDPFMTTNASPQSITAPVLAVAGGRDRIHPPAGVRQTVARLGGSLMTYETMSHWLIGEPGHESVARDCLDWMSSAQRAAA